MSSGDIIYLAILIVPSVLVSLVVGFYVGCNYALRKNDDQIQSERTKTMNVLQTVLASTHDLTSEVDNHNIELLSVGESVVDMQVGSGLEVVQRTLLERITDVVDSNRRLEDDLVVTRYQLEEQAQELDRTRVEARIDSLSGVGNRKSFDESLQYFMSRYHRRGKPFCLVMTDVDHFKWINDTHGHQSGDLVVALLGEAFKDVVRPNDHVARFGGDEFGILLADVDDEIAKKVAERVRHQVETKNFDVGMDDARVAVTLSIGACMVEADDSIESILRKADEALYNSKKGGRNQVTWYGEESSQAYDGEDVPSYLAQTPA